MLDLTLEKVSFRYGKTGFGMTGISQRFDRHRCTMLAGAGGSGKTTLLRLLSGALQPMAGLVFIGTREVNGIREARRPLLYASSVPRFPLRWSVQHVLVAAIRQRPLDRSDRRDESGQIAKKWRLDHLLERACRTLSATELLRVQLAEIEALRPAVLLLERLFASASPSEALALSDQLYRDLRTTGATIVSEPARLEELGFSDGVVVMDGGKIVLTSTAADLWTKPATHVAALALGDVNAVPVVVRGSEVESVIGVWNVGRPPFQGNGIALIRPTAFEIASKGEESDFIFGIEEAVMAGGSWMTRGFITGGSSLKVALPANVSLHKGKLLPLRLLAASSFPLVKQEQGWTSVPTDVVPPRSESR